MKTTLVSCACALAASAALCRGGEPANFHFRPSDDLFVRAGKAAYVNEPLLAMSSDGEYVAVLRFDTSLLRLVGEYNLLSARLKLGGQYVRRARRPGRAGALLAAHRVLKPWSERRHPWTRSLRLEPGVDYEKEPWVTVESPPNLKVGDTILTSAFPRRGSAAEMLAAFRRGIVLRLIPRQGDSIIQVNVHSRESRKTRPALVLRIRPRRAQLSLRPPTRILPGRYVTAKNGCFYLAGRRIRFWGINIQAGAFPSYEAIDHVARRLRNMGFNAVRVWPTTGAFYTPESAARKQFRRAVKGDGSPLDLYDYMIFRLKQEGLFIHNTALGYISSIMREHWPGLRVRYKRKRRGFDNFHYNVIPIYRYINDAYLEMSAAHARNYLNHRNPYTGKRYAEEEAFATWELTNENHFVDTMLRGEKYAKLPDYFKADLRARWNEWLRAKYKTTAALRRAWGGLQPGESLERGGVSVGPHYEDAGKLPAARGRDFVQFVTERFVQCSRYLEKTARSQAPAGVGIRVAPIAYNTHADFSLHAHYAASQGDFMARATYQTRYTKDRSKPHYPWRPIVCERPYFYNFNYAAVAGKPFLVYEASFFRPRPHRAEYAPVLAALAAGQDWDAVYFYTFGQPWAIAPPPCSDLDFCSRPLTMPYNASHDGYCAGFHHGNDEIFMASLALAGRAFLSGSLQPCPREAVVTYGRRALFDPAMRSYHPRGKVRVLSDHGQARWKDLPQLYMGFFWTSIRSRLRLAFDPRSSAAVTVRGPLALKDDLEAVQASESIRWDPPRGRLVMDSPQAKLVVGFIRDGQTFRGGVRVTNVTRDFAMFGLAALDGKPLRESGDMLLALVSTSANTGYAFDPTKIGSGPVGHVLGIVDRGRWPVAVQRVGAEVHLPARGTITRYNFALYPYAAGRFDRVLTFTEDEPLFLARIRRD